MSTESTRQVTTASVDRLGISVASSSRNVRSARSGTLYDPASIAAAQPVWFHPMPDGQHLALFSRRLRGATAGGLGPTGTVLYGAATDDAAPCWATFSPATGARGPVRAIPSRKTGTRTLTAAATRGDFLFTLNLYRPLDKPNQVNALLQNFRVTARDNIILEEEEFVPGNLGLGLYADRSHVWVFGDNGKGELALARKNWGRIGTNGDPNATRLWQFRGLDGWYSDPKKMVAVPGPKGKGIPAAGPCSVGRLRDRYYLAATGKVPAVPAKPGTPTGGTTGQAATAAVTSAVNQLTAVVNGVINGFLGIGPGTVAIITDLLARANEAVSGIPGVKDTGVTDNVAQFLRALTGTPEQGADTVADPASLLEQVMGAVSGVPVVGDLVTTAGDFLNGVVTSALGLGSALLSAPATLLTQIVSTLTGVDLTQGTDPTGTTGGTPRVPASWYSRIYTNRQVDEVWSATASADVPLGDESTYLGGGLYLQPQLGLSRGFTHTVTSNGLTVLDAASHHVQVFTGSAPQTIILPGTAKPLGTTIEPDGSVTVPESAIPHLSIADASVTEGNSGTTTIRFTVTSTLSPDEPITVGYETTAGTATADQDYVTASGTLTIAGGTTSQQVAITVNGDTTAEADEKFTITLSNPVGALLGTATATGTIVNDDSANALQSLLSDFQNLLNGIASGAVKIGQAVTSTIATILEQATRTITGTVGLVGEAVLGLVGDFLKFVSGGAIELLGGYTSPGEALAGIIDLITGGSGAVEASIADLGQTLYSAVTTTAANVGNLLTGAFHQVVNGITGIFSLSMAAPPLALASAPSETPAPRVSYMSYTIHNQSTHDVTVMSFDRTRTVTVPHGIGTVFTPYRAQPLAMSDWSWAFSAIRAPKGRVGFPAVRTLGVGTSGTGSPEGDFTFQTQWSVYDPTQVPATTPATTTPAAPPTTAAADPDLLKELIKRFTVITNSITSGALAVGTGVVDTVTSLLLGSVTAMTGANATDPDGTIRSLTTDLLQNLAKTGPSDSTASAFENLIRQITGGTGLTGGMVQGVTVPTPLEFVQQVVDAAGNVVADVVEGLSNLFAQIVNAITGN